MKKLLTLCLLILGLTVIILPARSQERTLTVFAAASLTDAFNAAKTEFQRRHPGVNVRLNFGSSSALRVQIEQGAPADVFASADYEQMQPLVKRGLIGPPKTFARNQLVLVTPTSNPGKVKSLQDLARPGLRLVATTEAVPIGHYTQQMLRQLSTNKEFGADYAEKVNANVLSREATVRGVLAKVELGEADAGIVYATDARTSQRIKSYPIPATINLIAAYPVSAITASPRTAEAEQFIRFLLSPSGQSVLKQYGFR